VGYDELLLHERYIPPPSMVQQPLVGQGLLITEAL